MTLEHDEVFHVEISTEVWRLLFWPVHILVDILRTNDDRTMLQGLEYIAAWVTDLSTA